MSAVRKNEVDDVANGASIFANGDSATGRDGWKAWTLFLVVAAIAMAANAVDTA